MDLEKAARISGEECERLRREIAKMREDAAKTLSLFFDKSTCDGCGATIWWATTRKGKKMPISENVVPHWADCPKSDRFRRKRT